MRKVSRSLETRPVMPLLGGAVMCSKSLSYEFDDGVDLSIEGASPATQMIESIILAVSRSTALESRR